MIAYALNSRNCHKIVVNLFTNDKLIHKSTLIGYGNKDYIISKMQIYVNSLHNMKSSIPFIEEYECQKINCKCNEIFIYTIK